MEPRELWERHTVLAQAFCHSDEEVKTAQTTLDDAQASRARSLAAFAVVVGNDKAVAEMLGLPEREVRIARRTVGREDARMLADDLLMPPQVRQAGGGGRLAEAEPLPSAAAAQAPAPTAQQELPQQQPQAQQHSTEHAHAHAYEQPQPQLPEHPQSYEHPQEPVWSPVQDAVLIDGWQSGVDMEILAIELGTDLPRLTARAQYLFAQGRLSGPVEEGGAARQGGRHRRNTMPVPQHGGGPVYHMPAAPPAPLPDGLIPDGLMSDGQGGYWANWNEMLPAPQM